MKLWSLFMMVSFYGCVGTVENAKVPVNNLFTEDKNTLIFKGIDQARAISHDKIEVEFTPIQSSDPDLKYHLFINGNVMPVEIDPSALDMAPGGRLRYLLTGLSINSTYKLRLRLFNTKTNQYSFKETEFSITTFDSRTSDFFGISSAIKVPGQSSSSVKVNWLPAKMEGLILPEDYDPYYYEITYTSSSGPSKLVDPTFVGPDKITFRVPPEGGGMILKDDHPTSTYISSLLPDTTYYFNVRAVHKLWNTYKDQNHNPIPVDKELNTKFITVKTDPATGIFDLNRDGLSLYNVPGKDALTMVNAFWTPASGVFQKYHLYVDKYLGSDDPAIDDKLTAARMVTLYDSSSFYAVNTDVLNKKIISLEPYSWYQFKVVACLDKDNCSPAEENGANRIVSFMKAIKTEPALVQFSGIVKALSPKNSSDLSNKSITIQWDKISLESGYAEDLEMYCIDPSTANSATPSYRKLTTTQIAGSVAGCENIALSNTIDMLADSSAKVVNLKMGQKYCFAMSPVINDVRHPVAKRSIPPVKWVTRCITPEVKTPTVAEFSGIGLNCSINQDNASFSWNTPKGGIYEEYVLFQKDLSIDTTPFKYSDAVATANLPGSAYSSTSIPVGTNTKTLTLLEPGNKYRFGMLTKATMGTTDYYSEYNVNITECTIPMPKATFKEWSRIFAIGPKTDGRVPLDVNRKFQESGLILEALNQDGIPVEIKDSADPFFLPPGNYATTPPTSFGNQAFDGTHGRHLATYVMASNSGAISLAWIDVDLEFRGSTFTARQDSGSRTQRKFGYRIYRSDDNKITWKDLTSSRPDSGSPSGLIHATNYSYRFLSNKSPITQRMAFFTDYSASFIREFDAESTERGRIFWYKIVPVYNGRELSYDDTSVNPHHLVKVILPPPNMALIHRKMANRTACNEFGRNPDVANHYRCDYVGLGAVAKGYPWRVGETVLDQEGDLLVDRFELGCQYTRGDLDTSNSDESYSFFPVIPANMPSLRGFRSNLPNFFGKTYNTNLTFQGCTGRDIPQNFEAASSWPDITINKYKKVVHGDCLANDTPISMMTNYCEGEWGDSSTFYFPGSSMSMFIGNGLGPTYNDVLNNRECSTTLEPDGPYWLNGKDPANTFSGVNNTTWYPHLVNQSEFMAVLHKRVTTGRVYSTRPSYKIPNGSVTADVSKCMINLASIGSDGSGWKARWLGIGQLASAGHISKTVDQMKNNSGYWGVGANPATDTHQMPQSTEFWNKRRFVGDTRLARIMTSNGAKLPPLTGVQVAEAEKICNALDIQVGFYNSNTGWSPQTTKLPKKLMWRKEQVTAAAWPESSTYTTTSITALEKGDTPGMCVGPANSTQTVAAGNAPGNLINPRVPMEAAGSNLFLSGSSKLDNSSYHSSQCISKYGIQDLVGNATEQTPHLLFCDYTKDHLYVGKEDVPGSNQFKPSESVEVPDFDETTWIPAGEDISDPGKSPTPVITAPANGFKTWAYIDPTSGYCSVVDNIETRSKVTGQGFFVESGEFKPLFNIDGTLNTNMVPSSNTINQSSVNSLRDGSGYYLNFGALNLAPRLGPNNSLAISGGPSDPSTTGLGKYFNPYVGLPLSCGDSHFCSPGQTVKTESDNDNTLIQNDYLYSKVQPPEPINTSFPTHNSQISHTGISNYVEQVMVHNYDGTTATLPTDPGPYVIKDLTVTSSSTRSMSYNRTNLKSFLISRGPGNYRFVNIQFSIDRGTVFQLESGGRYNNGGNGRYTMGMGANNWTSEGTGFRCSVLIKDN